MVRNNRNPLTLEQIAEYAPSALATSAHESTSDRYAHIPTVQVIEALADAGFRPFAAMQSRTRLEDRRGFTKHMLRFRHENALQAMVGESIPELVLVNAHDGSARYKLMGGFFVLVCSNGLVIAESTVASVSIKHTGDVIAQVLEGSTRVIDGVITATEVVKEWSGLMLTNGEQLALADSARTLRFADENGQVDTPITAQQLLQARRYADNSPSLWHTFNRIQENVIQGGARARYAADGSRLARAYRARSVQGIDQNTTLNRALWQLAEAMANLKK